MTFQTRGIRAVRAATDPLQVVNELVPAFNTFKADQNNRLTAVESMIADVAARNAALGLSAGSLPANPDRTEINAALRAYIGRGDDAPLAAMQTGSDPDGGYAVTPHFSDAITRRIFELSPMRQAARVIDVSSDSFEELLDLNEATAAWVGETQSRPETGTPQLGKLSIPVREIYAMPKVTQRLLDDARIDLAGWVVAKAGERFARLEGAAWISGDGVQKPRGLLTYPTAVTADATRAWGTLQHVNTGTSAGFGTAPNGSDKLIDLVYSLKVDYRAKARWLMNRQTAGAVRKLKDAEGRYVWTDSLTEGEPPRLLGFPVTLDENMPDIAADSLSIAFGDFSAGYTIVDRLGTRVLRDPLSAKPHVLFYTWRRTGGDVSNFDAVKLLRFGT